MINGEAVAVKTVTRLLGCACIFLSGIFKKEKEMAPK